MATVTAASANLYGEWRKTISATMRQTHPAGEKLFVDYAGDTVPVFDQITNAQRPAHIFVAALGASEKKGAAAPFLELAASPRLGRNVLGENYAE
jgi:transposase